MSELIVEVCPIDQVINHPNADRLEIATVKGWQTVVGKGMYKKGDVVVYIPPNSIIPKELSDSLCITKYLHSGRVKPAKLRGSMSFGVVMKNEYNDTIGTNVADKYGITKWEPEVSHKACNSHPLFFKYTDIQNMNDFPTLLEGHIVVVTEKIHGMNTRYGLVFDDEHPDGLFLVGSHNVQKAEGDYGTWGVESERAERLLRFMKEYVYEDAKSIILYGEVYGYGVQKLHYNTKPTFRAFDMSVDGVYLPMYIFNDVCTNFGINIVPVDAIIEFDYDKVKELANAKSSINSEMKEGVVVKLCSETNYTKGGIRPILKLIGDEYWLSNHDNGTH